METAKLKNTVFVTIEALGNRTIIGSLQFKKSDKYHGRVADMDEDDAFHLLRAEDLVEPKDCLFRKAIPKGKKYEDNPFAPDPVIFTASEEELKQKLVAIEAELKEHAKQKAHNTLSEGTSGDNTVEGQEVVSDPPPSAHAPIPEVAAKYSKSELNVMNMTNLAAIAQESYSLGFDMEMTKAKMIDILLDRQEKVIVKQ